MYAAIRKFGESHSLQIGFTQEEIQLLTKGGAHNIYLEIAGRAETGFTLERRTEGAKIQIAPQTVHADYVAYFKCTPHLNLHNESVRSRKLEDPILHMGKVTLGSLPKEFWLLKKTRAEIEAAAKAETVTQAKVAAETKKVSIIDLLEVVRVVNHMVVELSTYEQKVDLLLSGTNVLGFSVHPRTKKGT